MTKLSRQNVGGIDYTMVGCTLTGVCASAASDYVKAVTLSDGDILADGMSVVITFANGNTAGTAPASLTIYSSDQVNYYSDSGLTQPFTLAPSGCYEIEYTGTGNAYTYTSYPVLQVEGVTAPLCDSCGKKTSGAVWDAGDTVLMLYSGNKFMVISGLTNVVTAGSRKAVTSDAVSNAISYDFSHYVIGEESIFVITVPYLNNNNSTDIGSILINARYGYRYILDFYAFINESSLSNTADRIARIRVLEGALASGNYLESKLKWDIDTTNKKIKFYLKKNSSNTRINFKVLQNYNSVSNVAFSVITDVSVWNNAQYSTDFEYLSPIDSVTDGSLRPVTSNAVYNNFLSIKKGSNTLYQCWQTSGDYTQHWAKLFSFAIGRQYSSVGCIFNIIVSSINRGKLAKGYIGGYTQTPSQPSIWNAADTINGVTLYYDKTVDADGNVIIDVYVPTYTDNYIWWILDLECSTDVTVYQNPTLITDVSNLTAFSS